MTTETAEVPTAETPVETKAEAKPPEPKPEAKPAETPEAKALKLETLKLAREARELKERLATLESERKEYESKRTAEAEEMRALAERDPGAWIERLAGMPRADLAKRLQGQKASTETLLQKRLDELAGQLAERERKDAERLQKIEAQESEARRSNAYRAVVTAAKASEETHAAAELLKLDPKGASAWVLAWADTEWPKVAEAEGLDAHDADLAAKTAAKVYQEKQLDKLRKLVQTPSIARAIGLSAQNQSPAASQGTKPAQTITADLAASRSAAEPNDRPLTASERDRLAELAAIRFIKEKTAQQG